MSIFFTKVFHAISIKNIISELRLVKKLIFINWNLVVCYRASFVFSILSNLVPLMGIIFLWQAVYLNIHLIDSYSKLDMTRYVLLAYLCNQIISPFGIEWEISTDINEGRLSKYLLYPINYIKYRYFITLTEKISSIMIKIPFFLLVAYVYDALPLDVSLLYFCSFIISIFLSFTMYYLITFIVSISSFWFTDISGIFFVTNTIVTFFSGMLFPLTLFPAKLFAIMHYFPFFYMLFFPLQIYYEKLSIGCVLFGLSTQGLWIVVLVFLSRIFWSNGLKRYIASGG